MDPDVYRTRLYMNVSSGCRGQRHQRRLWGPQRVRSSAHRTGETNIQGRENRSKGMGAVEYEVSLGLGMGRGREIGWGGLEPAQSLVHSVA